MDPASPLQPYVPPASTPQADQGTLPQMGAASSPASVDPLAPLRPLDPVQSMSQAPMMPQQSMPSVPNAPYMPPLPSMDQLAPVQAAPLGPKNQVAEQPKSSITGPSVL